MTKKDNDVMIDAGQEFECEEQEEDKNNNPEDNEPNIFQNAHQFLETKMVAEEAKQE